MRFQTMCYMRPSKPQVSLQCAQSDQSFCKSLEYSMSVKLLSEYHFKSRLNRPARLSLHVSKCHIVGNHMSQLHIMSF